MLFTRVLRMAVVLAAVAPIGTVHAQGARAPGEGVICAYGLYAALQFTAKVCDWERVPFDDMLDQAIADIEGYILVNASDPSVVERTRGNMLAGEAIWRSWPTAEQQAYCEQQAKAQTMAGVPVRATDPGELERAVKELLAVPGEPTLGSCL